MRPVTVPFQGLKKLLKDRGHAYEADHGAILLHPPARRR
jgi:hypothetical protein